MRKPMTASELERRLMMFEPFIPRIEVMAAVRALHGAVETADEAVEQVRFWRRVALVSLLVTIAAALVASGVLLVGTNLTSELLVYQRRCVTHEAANMVLSLSNTIAAVNRDCVANHEDDRQLLLAAFSRTDNIYSAAQDKGTIYAVGGTCDDEAMSLLPDGKATDFFLLSEEPLRRSGVMVQALQQPAP